MQQGNPTGISVTPHAKVLVTLPDANQIVEFNHDGSVVREIDVIRGKQPLLSHALRLLSGQLIVCFTRSFHRNLFFCLDSLVGILMKN